MSSPPAKFTTLLDFSQPGPQPPVIEFQQPPKEALDRYDRTRRPEDQHEGAHVPTTFRDAMVVREKVFVQEQHVPMEYEFDDDDPRSAHWVVYSSDQPQPIPIPGRSSGAASSQTTRVPVGTIRLVPFPHPAHPKAGGVYVDGKLVSVQGGDASDVQDVQPRPPTGLALWSFKDRPTTHHDGREPYLKLGRLAVVPSHRGRRLAGVLVNAAVDWAVRNYDFFDPPNISVGGSKPRWKGLICVHAQKAAVGTWHYQGFVVDREMGEWMEEGIPHVGMFRRVNVAVETVRPPLPTQG